MYAQSFKDVNRILEPIEGLDPGTAGRGKLINFDEAVKYIGDDGGFKGYTRTYYVVKEAERLLHKYGYIDAPEPMHPVDRIADFVVHNKYYWGGILGLSAVPALAIGLEELKRLEHEITD